MATSNTKLVFAAASLLVLCASATKEAKCLDCKKVKPAAEFHWDTVRVRVKGSSKSVEVPAHRCKICVVEFIKQYKRKISHATRSRCPWRYCSVADARMLARFSSSKRYTKESRRRKVDVPITVDAVERLTNFSYPATLARTRRETANRARRIAQSEQTPKSSRRSSRAVRRRSPPKTPVDGIVAAIAERGRRPTDAASANSRPSSRRASARPERQSQQSSGSSPILPPSGGKSPRSEKESVTDSFLATLFPEEPLSLTSPGPPGESSRQVSAKPPSPQESKSSTTPKWLKQFLFGHEFDEKEFAKWSQHTEKTPSRISHKVVGPQKARGASPQRDNAIDTAKCSSVGCLSGNLLDDKVVFFSDEQLEWVPAAGQAA